MKSRRPLFLALPVLFSCLAGCGRSERSSSAQPAQRLTAPLIEPGDDGKTIVARAIKAFGGVEMFKRWHTGSVKYLARGQFISAQVGETTAEDTFQLPGHFKRDSYPSATVPALAVTLVINDSKGW